MYGVVSTTKRSMFLRLCTKGESSALVSLANMGLESVFTKVIYIVGDHIENGRIV